MLGRMVVVRTSRVVLVVCAACAAPAARPAPPSSTAIKKGYWCSSSPAEHDEGLCFPDKESCDGYRDYMAKNAKGGDELVACYQQRDATCFRMQEVATSKESELCATTLVACNAGRQEELGRNIDFKVLTACRVL